MPCQITLSARGPGKYRPRSMNITGLALQSSTVLLRRLLFTLCDGRGYFP